MDNMKGEAAICFIPGICSDDGRALTGWWNIYVRHNPSGHFWDEPELAKTQEEAVQWCVARSLKIVSVSAC